MRAFKLLVVHEHIHYSEIIKEYLVSSEYYYDVITCLSIHDVFEKAIRQLPDLILIEWPETTDISFDLLKSLKNHPATLHIPVIISTSGIGSSQTLKKALEAGAFDFIKQPVDRNEFIARINSATKISTSIQLINDQKNELIKLNKTKDKLLSILSHDLRAPLGNISTLLDLVISDINDGAGTEVIGTLSVLKESVFTSYNLLDNMLLWAKSNSGRLMFKPNYVSLFQIVQEIEQLFLPIAKRKEIAFINTIKNEIQVFADKNMLNCIIRNFVSNALKYTGKNGTVTIEAHIEHEKVAIKISDTGIGIRPEAQQVIFNPTQYFSTKGTNYEVGSGLGLLICKDFVSMHNSTIKVESSPGQGSAFSFEISLIETDI